MANTSEGTPAYLIDGVQAVAIHNGVARIQFMKMDMGGKAASEVELMIPLNQIAGIIEGLQKISSKR